MTAPSPTDGTGDDALDGISVSPPVPDDKEAPIDDAVREGKDARSHETLGDQPMSEDAKLDIGLDETFPSSDAPANTRPGSDEPAPSSGYDEDEERARLKGLDRPA